MDELELFFLDLNEEETDLVLKDIAEPCSRELSQKIKARAGVGKSTDIRAFPLIKLLPFAAVFLLVFAATLAAGLKGGLIPASKEPTTLQATTQQPPEDNPLMVAISTGDEDIIQKLLSVPGVITKETLDFALNFSNLISYDTLRSIALSVRDSLGSTGLDGLIEGALMGDTDKVVTELSMRDKLTMNPFERLAFFFAVAFCDSEAVESFVERGYDINIKDASGNSIYAIAEKYGNEDTKQYAVSMGITS
ncbi:MAG: hypothetical protein E7538_07805 [Ruminococcaceae bacterium]|nr:hypothetical protein [Oscillospiraceae bacterium]